MTTPTINPARLNRTLSELGRIGETPQGMMRLAYSPADVQGREYAIALMRRAGLETRIDPAGNIIGARPAPPPTCRPLPSAPTPTPCPWAASMTAPWALWAPSKRCKPWPKVPIPSATR